VGARKTISYKSNLKFISGINANIIITTDGIVGIGTMKPEARLEVHNSGTEDILNLFDDTKEVFTVMDGGNIGIGTNKPAEKLDINGAMHLTPGNAPSPANEGDIYMDAFTHKLRCYDGTSWHDMW